MKILRLAVVALVACALVTIHAHTLPPDTYWMSLLFVTDAAHPDETWDPQVTGPQILANLDRAVVKYSWGQKRLIGEVYGWYHLAETVPCSQLYPHVRTLMTTHGIDNTHFFGWIYPYGRGNCYSHAVAMGTGRGRIDLTGPGSAVHEMVHAMGAMEEGDSWNNNYGIWARTKYGDIYSPIGGGGSLEGFPAPLHLQWMGFVNASFTAQLITAAGEYDVPRLDLPGPGVKYFRLNVPNWPAVYFSVRKKGAEFHLVMHLGSTLVDLDPTLGKDYRLDVGQTVVTNFGVVKTGSLVVTALQQNPDGSVRMRVEFSPNIIVSPGTITAVQKVS